MTNAMRLAAEFSPQRAVWMGWPANPQDWPGKFAAVKWAFVEMIRLFSHTQTVRLLTTAGAIVSQGSTGGGGGCCGGGCCSTN